MMDSKRKNIYKSKKSVHSNTCSNGPQESLKTEIFLGCVCGNKLDLEKKKQKKKRKQSKTNTI